MDKARWDKISTMVDKIITLNKKEQTSYLEKTLAGQDELIAEVKEYLQAIEESESEQFLENPLSDYSTLFKELAASDIPDEPNSEELLGMQIGPYKVESLIAQGGMGSVYLAKRVDGQFEQDVAIKFISKSNLSEEGLHRFQQEQKILANLRHHNIAMLLDGGISDNGRPFLILEYIEGTPIDEYCNRNNLSISHRLNLFKEVLQTIEYAHSNLVIHRDLKPSNILVTASGEVKILDFGIAKLLDNNTDNDLLKTQPGQRLWTPSYAAPEQVQEKPSVTQTDVYALGGLLHKLLSNKPAFNFSNDKIYQIENKILKSKPDGLLSAINSQEEAELFKNFGVKKSSLKKQLNSDLEAIVNKALRKETEHRYHSVSLFLNDIIRLENNLPISAKKDNFKYLASKFYSRNKQPLLYASLIITAIISMVIYYTIQINEQRHIAELEAEKATQVSDYLSNLFSHNYPENAQGEDVTARQLLDQGVDQLYSLDNQPEVQVAMLNLFSNIYHNIEELSFADSLAMRAIEVNEEKEIYNAKELAASNYTLGLVNRDNGNYDSAIVYMQRSLDLDGLTNSPADTNYAARLSALAYVLRLNDNLEEAAEKNNRAIEIQRRLYGENNINLAESIYIQASILRVLGRYEEALEHQFDSYNMVKDLVDPPHPGLAVNLSNIALIMQKTGKYEESEKYNRESLKMTKKLYGENNSMVATSIRNLATSIQSQGRLDEALQYQKDALSISLNKFGDDHINTANSYGDLGVIYAEQGEVEKADLLLKKALEIKVSVYGEESIQISKTLSNLAEVEVKRGNKHKALKYLEKSLKIRNERLGEMHPETQNLANRFEELSSKIDN